MPLSRRTFTLGALAAPAIASTLVPQPVAAATHASSTVPTRAHASLGAYRITALLDGTLPIQREFFFGPDAARMDQVLSDAGVGPEALHIPVSAYLLRSDDRTVLIDAGFGGVDFFGRGFGQVSAALSAAGVSADEIDAVIITHLHVDHIGGLLSADGRAFPNAEIIVAEAEAAFWTDAAMQAAAPADAQGLFQLAQSVLAIYEGHVTLASDGEMVLPGLEFMLSPGHTPGHSVLRIDGGDTQLLMIADTVANLELQLALPDTGFAFDVDSAAAAQSRRQIFDVVAADKMLVAGSHIHFPGFGRILTDGDAYRFMPATWS